MLFLPEPTGNIAIDAKFPLENYRLLINSTLTDIERQHAEKQFKIDIKNHIQAIAEKYIIPGETADGAVMFIPAEAVFAEIHA
jgi:DNA recombination protein RmuC